MDDIRDIFLEVLGNWSFDKMESKCRKVMELVSLEDLLKYKCPKDYYDRLVEIMEQTVGRKNNEAFEIMMTEIDQMIDELPWVQKHVLSEFYSKPWKMTA